MRSRSASRDFSGRGANLDKDARLIPIDTFVTDFVATELYYGLTFSSRLA
ncbi:MAG: hypothetical protein NTX48_06375 [Planctomycetales bacterium]|nr:hypothetical protein [Planctomycetales bacterium]